MSDERSLAEKIVSAVMLDLSDRSGFDGWWGSVDDVQLDVVTDLEDVVGALLQAEGVE